LTETAEIGFKVEDRLLMSHSSAERLASPGPRD
jgi:hypothetical protein